MIDNKLSVHISNKLGKSQSTSKAYETGRVKGGRTILRGEGIIVDVSPWAEQQ